MLKRVHRNDARIFTVGCIVFGVIAVIAYFGVTVQAGGKLPFKSYTYVKAAFADVGTLKHGLDVTENGVRIGDVDKIQFSNGAAVVTMRLDGTRAVYTNARASVLSQSALGRKEVGLDPGSASAPLLGDAVIPEAQTTSSTSLDDVFAAFDPSTRAALQTAMANLGGGLGGHGQDLNALLQHAPGLVNGLSVISGALASPDTNLRGLLSSADRLAGSLNARSSQLAQLLTQVNTTLKAVTVDDGRPLTQIVQQMPSTLRAARSGLDALNPSLHDLEGAMTALRPGAIALGSAVPSTRQFLVQSVPTLEKVHGVATLAVPAVDSLIRPFLDARPVAPLAAGSLQDAAYLLAGLSPYATDLGRFFSEEDLLSGELTPSKHYFSAQLSFPGLRNLSVPDPTTDRVPYPQPGGGAWADNPGTAGTK